MRLDNPLESRSLAERAEDAALAWGLIRAVPLTGTGPGYYAAALWAGVRGMRPPDFRTVHSIPLLAAAELGIPGAILWLWLVCAPPLALYLRARRAPVSPMQAGLAAAWVCAAIVSLFDNYLYIPVTWWPAFYLGIVAGLWAREYAQPGGF
jgi:O-antigen ligase